MTSQIPTAMTALALSKYSKPSEYNIATLPVPEISKPDELLVKVHAAAVNPIDVKLASGLGKMLDPGTRCVLFDFSICDSNSRLASPTR